MPEIVIVDTGILLNILGVSGRDQKRETVFAELKTLVSEKADLFLPVATVFETGRFIAKLQDGGERRRYAEKLRDHVREGMREDSSWTLVPFPEQDEIEDWMTDFPDAAMRGLSLTDLSLTRIWESQRALGSGRRVRIWSLDRHLQGYDYQPSPGWRSTD